MQRRGSPSHCLSLNNTHKCCELSTRTWLARPRRRSLSARARSISSPQYSVIKSFRRNGRTVHSPSPPPAHHMYAPSSSSSSQLLRCCGCAAEVEELWQEVQVATPNTRESRSWNAGITNEHAAADGGDGPGAGRRAHSVHRHRAAPQTCCCCVPLAGSRCSRPKTSKKCTYCLSHDQVLQNPHALQTILPVLSVAASSAKLPWAAGSCGACCVSSHTYICVITLLLIRVTCKAGDRLHALPHLVVTVASLAGHCRSLQHD